MTPGTVTTIINGGLTLSEYPEGIRFGTDALLLSAFALPELKKGVCADFGTGSGILPLLLLSAGCPCSFAAVELQEKYAHLAQENAGENGYADRMRVLCGDVRDREIQKMLGPISAVVSNPPYLKTGAGKQNLSEEKRLAWHEEFLTAKELAESASRVLQQGGRFFCIYLPERLTGLLSALREFRLEPKRMQLVCPSPGEKPSLVLIGAVRGAKEGMVCEAPFYLYEDRAHKQESERLRAVYRLFGDRNHA